MRRKERDAYPAEQEVLDRRPEWDDAIAMCVECWHALGSCRPVGFGGVGAIPFTAVLTWAQFHELDRELTMLLVDVLQRLEHDRAVREASKRALQGV